MRSPLAMLREQDGAAAVEFALIAPLMVAMLAVFADFSVFLLRRAEMSSAVNTAVRYYISGGGDVNEAAAVAQSAWKSRPAGGTVTVLVENFCGETLVQPGSLCAPGNSAPEVRPRIVASATFPGLFGDRDLALEDSIRVR